MEVVALLSQGRTAAAQCGLFAYESVPVIFEPPCTCRDFHCQMLLLECCLLYVDFGSVLVTQFSVFYFILRLPL